MSKTCNNSAELSLNDKELAIAEGFSLASQGEELADVLIPGMSATRVAGIKEGFHRFNSKGLADSVKAYSESPNPITFKSVVDSLEKLPYLSNLYLQGRAILSLNQKVQDSDAPVTIEYWLNRLLAEEFTAWYQYFITYKFLVGEERAHVQEVFSRFADDELNDHAASLIQRIHDLGCSDTWLSQRPSSWDCYAVAPYYPAGTTVVMALQTMHAAESDAINSYTQAVAFALGQNDYVSADLFKRILADEQEHYGELTHYLRDLTNIVTDSVNSVDSFIKEISSQITTEPTQTIVVDKDPSFKIEGPVFDAILAKIQEALKKNKVHSAPEMIVGENSIVVNIVPEDITLKDKISEVL